MEVIVTSENSGQLWNCCVWDPLTGTALRSFKGGISCSRTLTTISSDYLISAQKDKPIIQVAF
jgi:pre-rRNA-processing protein IPI3